MELHNLPIFKSIAKSIKELDTNIWNDERAKLQQARNILLNIILRNGYQLDRDYKIKKSQAPMELLSETLNN